MSSRLNRRTFLQLMGTSAMLAACAPAAPQTETAAPSGPAAIPTGEAGIDLAAPDFMAAPAKDLKAAKLLSVQHDSRPLDNAAWRNCRAMFNAKYPQVDIELSTWPWETARAKLFAANEADNLPHCGRNQYSEELAPLGAVLALDDLLSPEEIADNERRMPYSWPTIQYIGPDGERHIYGIPYFTGNKAILVNKTMFEEAGLDLAELAGWTWDDFKRIGTELTQENRWFYAMDAAGVGDPQQNFHLIVRAFGGGLIQGKKYADSLEPEPLAIKSPETIEGIRFFGSLYWDGLAQPSAPTDTYKERDAVFMSGRSMTMHQGPWSITANKETLAENGWELGALALPSGPGGAPNSGLGGNNVGLFRSAENDDVIEEALEWIRFVSSNEGQAIYCKTNGMIPASTDLWDDPFWADDPVYRGYLDGYENPDREWPVWMVGMGGVMDNIVVPLMQGLLTQRVTPEEFAEEWYDATVATLKENGVEVPTG